MEVIHKIGRRKTAVARIYLSEGSGNTTVNKKEMSTYFPTGTLQYKVKQPLMLTENLENFDVKVSQRVISRDDDKRYYNVDVEYEIKNDSDSLKFVTLQIPFNRHKDSKIKTEQEYSYTKGNMIVVDIVVDANSVKKFKVNYESKK